MAFARAPTFGFAGSEAYEVRPVYVPIAPELGVADAWAFRQQHAPRQVGYRRFTPGDDRLV